jgi:hypothetical protein
MSGTLADWIMAPELPIDDKSEPPPPQAATAAAKAVHAA